MKATNESASSSFLSGVARLVDFGGVFDRRQRPLPAAIADSRATRSDWEAVGSDMRYAIRRVDHELGRKKK